MDSKKENPAPRTAREFEHWLLFAVALLAVQLACLIQWGKPSLWTRLDIFSGGYLLLRALPVLRSLVTPFRAPISAESRRERFGLTSGRGVVGFSVLLCLADFAVFLDYGHWRLTPALESPFAQGAGLLLYLAVAVCNRWTSRYLGAAFDHNAVRPKLTQSGLYGYIRHPTYAGGMIQRGAEALVFASGIAWVFALFWWVLLLRQVRIEERHMRQLYGAEYEAYSRQTARLVPGVF